mgnify:CR=1 FL=1
MYDGDVEDQLPPSSCLCECVVGGERGKERGAVVPLYGGKVEASIRAPAKRLCINSAERGKTLSRAPRGGNCGATEPLYYALGRDTLITLHR